MFRWKETLTAKGDTLPPPETEDDCEDGESFTSSVEPCAAKTAMICVDACLVSGHWLQRQRCIGMRMEGRIMYIVSHLAALSKRGL